MTPCAATRTLAQKYFGSPQVGLSAFTGRPSPCVASEASKSTSEQQYVDLHLVVWTQTLPACLWMSTGQYGASSVRRTSVDSGVVQQQTRMGSDWFGEGIARYGDKLYQITWLTNRGFIYSIPDLKQVRPCCLCELCTGLAAPRFMPAGCCAAQPH